MSAVSSTPGGRGACCWRQIKAAAPAAPTAVVIIRSRGTVVVSEPKPNALTRASRKKVSRHATAVSEAAVVATSQAARRRLLRRATSRHCSPIRSFSSACQ